MNASSIKLAPKPEPPVFQIAIRKRIAKSGVATGRPKSPKRDNIFSKSRDTREDRGTREMKTTNNSQTFSHGRK